MILSRTRMLMIILAGLWFGVFFWLVFDSFVDDAYIGFSCMRNFFEGRGFYLNEGEPVECVTNIGWLLFLLPVAYFSSPTFAAKFMALLLVPAGLMLLYKTITANSEKLDETIAAGVILCSLGSYEFLYYSFSGMETSLCFFLAAGGLYFSQRQKMPASSLLLGLCFSVRPETVLVFPLFLVFCVSQQKAILKQFLKSIVLFVALLAVQQILRYLYFSAFLPNTFFAKPGNFSDFFHGLYSLLSEFGQPANLYFVFANPIALILVVFGFFRLWHDNRRLEANLCLSLILTGYIFAIYARPDWTKNARYFAPYLPFAYWFLLAGCAKVFAWFKFSLENIEKTTATVAGIVLALSMSESLFLLRQETQNMYPHYVANSLPLVEPSRWIAANIPENAVIATRRIGCLSYFGRRRIFDYKYGLPDPRVASLIRKNGEPFDNPQHPALSELWQKIQPDFIIEDSFNIYSFGYRMHKDSFKVHGIAYRPIKSFPINNDTSWLLCEKIKSTR